MYSPSHRFLICLTVLLLLLVLVACQPISSPATTVAPYPTHQAVASAVAVGDETLIVIPAERIAQDPNMLARACSSLMDMNLEETYAVYPSSIFWTFHMNFREFDDESKHVPIACLRFYWRDDLHKTFTTTVSSDFLIPCNVIGDLKLDTMAPIPSSLGVRSSVAISKATFLNGAYISCPLNLKLAIHQIVETSNFYDVVSAVLPLTNAKDVMVEAIDIYNSPNRSYDFFSMAAVIDSLDPKEKVYPLAYYEPDPPCLPASAKRCAKPTQFLLFADNEMITFEQTLDGTSYIPITPHASRCNEQCGYSDQDTESLPRFIWANYRLLNNAVGKSIGRPGDQCSQEKGRYVQFVTRINGHSETCSNPNIQHAVETQSINFWMGQATVYIGYRPNPGQSLNGSLYEVWIDPDNAIPPTRVDQ